MKTLFSTILFLSIATLTIGQTIAGISNRTSPLLDIHTIVLSPKKQERIAKKQNKSVVKQLHSYIASTLKYSTSMTENCMEGEVIIQVEFSDKGTITRTKIVKSPNQEIAKVVLEGLEGLDKIALEEAVYYGHKRIRIPVDFTIR